MWIFRRPLFWKLHIFPKGPKKWKCVGFVGLFWFVRFLGGIFCWNDGSGWKMLHFWMTLFFFNFSLFYFFSFLFFLKLATRTSQHLWRMYAGGANGSCEKATQRNYLCCVISFNLTDYFSLPVTRAMLQWRFKLCSRHHSTSMSIVKRGKRLRVCTLGFQLVGLSSMLDILAFILLRRTVSAEFWQREQPRAELSLFLELKYAQHLFLSLCLFSFLITVSDSLWCDCNLSNR